MTDNPELSSSLPPSPPVSPVIVHPRSSPLGPFFMGVFIILLLVAGVGAGYYFVKLRPSKEPSPTPAASLLPSPTPSPSATASATPRLVKPSLKPTSALKPTPSAVATPTPTPFSLPSLDVRFGNPSSRVKQTMDEGAGDGRVINREYTSIQAGQFDEIKSSWQPKITVCFHLTASEKVAGRLIKFTLTYDGKTEVEDNMSWIPELEAGRIYDWCHDVTTDLGKHTAKLVINADRSLKESNYGNDVAEVSWENLADNVAPNYTLMGPVNEGASGTCFFPQYIEDNVTPYTSLKLEHKIDAGAWAPYSGDRHCFVGTTGASHSYSFRITDLRGNKNEQSKTFVLY